MHNSKAILRQIKATLKDTKLSLSSCCRQVHKSFGRAGAEHEVSVSGRAEQPNEKITSRRAAGRNRAAQEVSVDPNY